MLAELGIRTLTTLGAGMLASLSPCVYPLLPITLGYVGSRAPGQVRRALAYYVLGQTITFTTLGILTVELGETLGFSSERRGVNLALGLFLIAMAAASRRGNLPEFVRRGGDWIQNRIGGSRAEIPRGNVGWSSIGLGAGTALIASPCTSPILGGVLGTIATAGTLLQGVWLMLAYSVGFSGLVALVAAGLLNLKTLPRSGRWLQVSHAVSVALLFSAGLYYCGKAILPA